MDRNQYGRRSHRDRQQGDYSRHSSPYAGSGYDDDYDDDRGYGSGGGNWRSEHGQQDSDSFEAYRSTGRGGWSGDRNRSGSGRQGGGYSGGGRFSERGGFSGDYSTAGYGSSRYGNREGGGFGGSFTGSDYGGRDFSGAQRTYGSGLRPSDQYGGSDYGERSFGGGGYGRSSGGNYSGGYSGESGGYRASGYSGGGRGSYSRGRREWGDPHNERGFFERAGDEVASWFGDEEAARRREMDHSGRGPQNYKRSDERVLEDACDRLTADWGVDASNIQVTVQNGEVTLDGTVSSRPQKRRAEDCVDDLPGVKHVQNNLRVQESGGWGGTGSSAADRTDTTTGTV